MEGKVYRVDFVTKRNWFPSCDEMNNPILKFDFIDLFEMRVSTSPDDVAVLCGEESLTFSELYRRAEQLAYHLQALGVAPNELVGIYVNRSLEMVVGILGILMSGGAYVPLDPAYPADRLSFILEDASIQIVVTQAGLRNRIPVKVANILCIGEEPSWLPEQEQAGLRRIISSEDLAYVIYTSGSTGRPKGVMITHDNLCQFVQIAGQALDVFPTDRYLQTASISYALSVRQLMIPLAKGATLVIANSEQVREPLELFKLIKRERISVMDMVPSFWRTCTQRLLSLPVDERRELLDNNLRRIVSIGEALLSDIPRDWRFKLGHPARLVNIFGQTETTGVVATYPIPPVDWEEIETVPIGWNVADTSLYVLDTNLRPVPPGAVGELCVSSPCVALGYLNRPELSSQKFISNPFEDENGTRLYRTGDRARVRSDGAIEFLGRNDFQVKIRGQRVELGEVEATLSEHPFIGACVAVAVEDNPNEKILVAYYTVSGHQLIGETDLRKFLKLHLPEHMIPSLFIRLKEIPLTPNGKIDRSLMASLEFMHENSSDWDANSTSNGGDDALIYPRTRTEEKLAKIWCNLLRRDRLGIYDDFFELGGDSLMAVRLFLYVEEEFGVRLPLTSLFHSATISQLARLIEHHDKVSLNWRPVVAIREEGTKPPFFGIHGHEGGVLFWRELVSVLPSDQPFYAVQAQGVDGSLPALMDIHKMAKLYLEDIRRVQPSGPYYLGGYSMGGEIALEVAQRLVQMGERVNLLVMFDTANPTRMVTSTYVPLLERDSADKYRQLRSSIFYKISRYWARSYGRGVFKRLWYHLQDAAHRAGIMFTFGLVNIYRVLRKRLPDALLLRYLRESHSKALYSYKPRLYPGTITLFRATQSLDTNPEDAIISWKNFAGGGFEMIVVDSTHEMLNAEFVPIVSLLLNRCLAKAKTR